MLCSDRHAGDRTVEGGERGAGVPVVEVDDVGSGHVDDRRDRLAERQEAEIVVWPSVTVGLQVRVTARQSRGVDDAESAELCVPSAADPGRPRPGRHRQVGDRFLGQLDAAVIGHHEVDVDALPAQLGNQSGGGLGEAADGGDRRQLGGGKEHAHSPIMLAGSNLRAMRSRRLLAVPTLAATALAGATFCGTASAGDGDRDVDKNVLLAEAQFQLFLVTSDFVPSDVTCTRPPVRDAAGELLCYALVSDRVSVAAVATMESPGVYTFTPLNKVDPAELARAEPTVDEPTAPEQPAPESPTSSEPDTDEPAGATDQAIVASLNTAADDAVGLGRVLTENNSSISSLDTIAYHEPTSTLQVAVTTNVTDSAAPRLDRLLRHRRDGVSVDGERADPRGRCDDPPTTRGDRRRRALRHAVRRDGRRRRLRDHRA